MIEHSGQSMFDAHRAAVVIIATATPDYDHVSRVTQTRDLAQREDAGNCGQIAETVTQNGIMAKLMLRCLSIL